MEQAHLKIDGMVQGVFFRTETREKARSLGLAGFVKNTDDGGVEIVAQGEVEKLNQFINWCKKGPAGAKVSNLKIQKENLTGQLLDFEIKY